jgi:hypothetical protein
VSEQFSATAHDFNVVPPTPSAGAVVAFIFLLVLPLVPMSALGWEPPLNGRLALSGFAGALLYYGLWLGSGVAKGSRPARHILIAVVAATLTGALALEYSTALVPANERLVLSTIGLFGAASILLGAAAGGVLGFPKAFAASTATRPVHPLIFVAGSGLVWWHMPAEALTLRLLPVSVALVAAAIWASKVTRRG